MHVALFATCLVDLMRPRIGFATLDLLEAAGCQVSVPENQTCCGQPAHNSGDRESAAALARKTIAEFDRPEFDYVVAPSGSCADHIRHEYPRILADDPVWRPRAERLAAKTLELTQFLVEVAKVERVPGHFAGRVTYHDSCTGLRSLGIKSGPRHLLALVPGLELKEMAGAEDCCGFGGAFSVKYGDLSAAIADRKCANVHGADCDALVAGDLGCLLHLEGRLRRQGDERTRVLHVAEILAGATDQDEGAP